MIEEPEDNFLGHFSRSTLLGTNYILYIYDETDTHT